MEIEAQQNFQLFGQNNLCFLRDNRLCLNVSSGFCITQLALSIYKIISP